MIYEKLICQHFDISSLLLLNNLFSLCFRIHNLSYSYCYLFENLKFMCKLFYFLCNVYR